MAQRESAKRRYRDVERGFMAIGCLAIAIGVLATTLSPERSNAETGDESAAVEASAPDIEGLDTGTDEPAPAPATEQVTQPEATDPTGAGDTAADDNPSTATDSSAEPVTIGEATTVAELAIASDLTADGTHVLRLYTAFFDRDPDLEGARFWVDQVNEGRSVDDIAADFATSTEFADRYGSMGDATFVRSVYRSALGRDLDDDGFDFWIGQLYEGMPREKVLVLFTSGEEFNNPT